MNIHSNKQKLGDLNSSEWEMNAKQRKERSHVKAAEALAWSRPAGNVPRDLHLVSFHVHWKSAKLGSSSLSASSGAEPVAEATGALACIFLCEGE